MNIVRTARLLIGGLAVLLPGCETTSPVVEPETFPVSVHAEPVDGGTVGGGGSFQSGESVTVLAVPAAAHRFVNWTEGGVEVSADPAFTFIVSGPRALVAHFTEERHTLRVIGEGTGSGVVSSNPAGINCTISGGNTTGECTSQHGSNATVTLTAVPEDGSTFDGWSGHCAGSATCVLAMTGDRTATATFVAPHLGSAFARYVAPSDFHDGLLSLELPPSPSGKTYLVAVPNLSSVDWFTGNPHIHSGANAFSLEAVSIGSGPLTVLRPLPSVSLPPLEDWGTPTKGAASELEPARTFHIWSQLEETYVPVAGELAFVGGAYAFYQDTTNVNNFTQEEYETLNQVLEDFYPRLRDLMGAPTDLDGNDRIVVFINRTMMQHRTFGEAYVDGCHLRVQPTGCVDRGEFVYIASLDHFSPSSGNRSFYVENYFPRNILHETAHLLQQAHGYRRTGTWASFSVPAYYSEGQAELMSMESGLRADAIWTNVRNRFAQAEQRNNSPFFFPYDMGAVYFWYVHQTFGDGVSQALIDAAYDSRRSTVSLAEIAVGIAEPLTLAMMYAALLFDGTEFGAEHGLHFPKDDVPARLEGVSPAVMEVAAGGAATAERSFTGAALFRIQHDGAVRVRLTASPVRAYVVVAQPQP